MKVEISINKELRNKLFNLLDLLEDGKIDIEIFNTKENKQIKYSKMYCELETEYGGFGDSNNLIYINFKKESGISEGFSMSESNYDALISKKEVSFDYYSLKIKMKLL